MQAFLVVGVAEVDEVAVVWEYLFWGEVELRAVIFEGLYFELVEVFGEPLSLVFGEQGEGGGVYLVGVYGGVLDASVGTDVSSDVFHGGCELWVVGQR